MSNQITRQNASIIHKMLKALCENLEKGDGEVDVVAFNILLETTIAAFDSSMIKLARAIHLVMPSEDMILRLIQEGKDEFSYMSLFFFDYFDKYWNTPTLIARGVRLVSHLRLSPHSKARFRIELQRADAHVDNRKPKRHRVLQDFIIPGPI